MALRLAEEAVELLHLVHRGSGPAVCGDDWVYLFTERCEKLWACCKVEEGMSQALRTQSSAMIKDEERAALTHVRRVVRGREVDHEEGLHDVGIRKVFYVGIFDEPL